MTFEIIYNLLALIGLVLANAFFVAAEFALVGVRRTKIQELVKEGHATATVVQNAITHLDDYISATQVGITLASLALGWLGEPFLAGKIFEPLFGLIVRDQTLSYVSAHTAAVAVAFSLITVMHVVMGELLPKSVALQYPLKVSLFVAYPMKFVAFMFRPLIWLLNGMSGRILRMIGVKPAEAHTLALSEEELLMLLSQSKQAGKLTEEEQKMVQRVFKFHDKIVKEIMIPRPDVVGIELRAGEKEIRAIFKEGYSRLPVFDGTLSNIKGIVYVKDLIYTLQDPKLINLYDLVREAQLVPESKAVSDLLREFQKNRVHMAIVIDEFGDTSGIVTLEDVIEEIVGEIQDEYDYEPAQVERAKDGSIIFDGKIALDRFVEMFPTFVPPEGSFETIAGLVLQIAGRVPKESDVVRHGELTFRVIKRDGRRLRRIAVKRDLPKSTDEQFPHHETAIMDAEAMKSRLPVASDEHSSSSRMPAESDANFSPGLDNPSTAPAPVEPGKEAGTRSSSSTARR